MSLSLRAVLPASSPMAALTALPTCSSPLCPRPPSLWQRWWARHEGIWLQQRWYCSVECFQEGVFQRLERVSAGVLRQQQSPSRLPLGLVLLSQGDINGEQLRAALEKQRVAKTGRLGEWLVRMGSITEAQVTAALAVQQRCPVFPICEPQCVPEALQWPLPLVHQYL